MFVWGVWFWGVGGLAGAVAGVTMVRLALGCEVCIMNGVRLRIRLHQDGGAPGTALRRGRDHE